MTRSRSLQGAAEVPLSLPLEKQGGGGRGRQRLHEGDTARSQVVVVVVVVVLVQRIGRAVWVGAVLGGCPGDDVSAVVRARASILAEVELERLNLSLGCLTLEPGAPGGPHYHREPPPSAHSHGQQRPLPALARSRGPGLRCHSGESHSPLLSPGPPQP